MKIKKIFSILLFLFIIFLSNRILGVEINVGDTYTFELRDVTDSNTGMCITEFTGATCNDDCITVEEVKTKTGLFKKSITSVKVTGKTQGTTNITLSGSYDRMVTNLDGTMTTVKEYISEKINITVKDMGKEVQKEYDNYKDAYKNVPAKNAVAKEIKEFILSDEKYNKSKALNQVAETDKEKIEAWYNTVTKLIASDRHYASDNQYGSTKSKLGAIIDSYEKEDVTTEEAIDSVDTSGAADLVEGSYERIIEAYSTQVSGSRDKSTFVDILDNVEGYAKPSDIDIGSKNKIENAASIVLSAITSIGVVASIVMLAVLGIKYMLGSVEEKAEYKKDLVPYIVGAFLLFGISTFVKIFMQWGETISNL